MKSNLKQSIWIALISIIFSSCTNTVEKLPESVILNIQNRIDYGLNGAIAIGIIDKNGVRYYNFGKRDSSGAEVNEHTIFEIASITKTFTATLLADQVIKGSLTVDDPVNEFLPDTIQVPILGNQEITLGHLSDHTSGLPRRIPSSFLEKSNNTDSDQIVVTYDFVSNYTPVRAVGKAFEYSNLATGLLGHVLSLQTGKTYEDLLSEIITTPLGMSETKITSDEQMKSNHAEGRNVFGPVKNRKFPLAVEGAGAIRNSTSDLVKYLSAQLGYTETPLKPAFELTHEKRHEIANTSWGSEDMALGLGWFYPPSANGEVLCHLGTTAGHKSYIGFNKLTKKGIVVLSTGAKPTELRFYLSGISDSLSTIKPVLTIELIKRIDTEGIEVTRKFISNSVINNLDTFDYNERRINRLGYSYLEENIDASIMIFEINIRLFPDNPILYNSYGEALRKKGRLEESLKNYRKSVELNPNNQQGISAITELEKELESKLIDK
ncbi:serine hydrolase [Seonamhaeicola maritimus]|uniref:serine hydrolase n=1 Tax=Seonamhaeicola maritimus TaxID=2591822 RepID=UPI002493DF13|nr:serine hydrolase [Seonamhaeicola maritimus]